MENQTKKEDVDVETGAVTQLSETTSTRAGEVVKGRWDRLWPVLAAGAGLFSDGYLNNVIGSVSTMLSIIYPTQYKNSPAQQNVSSITFAGTVLGILIFGECSDRFSRRNSLLASSVILIVTAILCTGSYGANGSIQGLFAALTAYRFLLGIGIGGEYPAGSVAAAEATQELKEGHRHRWFVIFTNVQIDFGFVIGAFVPLVCLWITTENNLNLAWRLALGFGVLPPLSLLYLRIKLQDSKEFQQNSMKNVKLPWKLIVKRYGPRWLVIASLWFIYNFSSYAFAIYSSTILVNIIGDSAPLWKSFGWNTVINLFYMPGAILGGFASDYFGPTRAYVIGTGSQAIIGFIMAGCYPWLAEPRYIGAFTVLYGIFLSLGEFGPGDNIGVIASKTSPTAFRGRYYGLAGAAGKIGAFIGSYVFPIMERDAPGGVDGLRAAQYPFWVAGSLCLLSCALAWFCLPTIDQNTIAREDELFRDYLEEHGWATRHVDVEQVQAESVAMD